MLDGDAVGCLLLIHRQQALIDPLLQRVLLVQIRPASPVRIAVASALTPRSLGAVATVRRMGRPPFEEPERRSNKEVGVPFAGAPTKLLPA